MLKPKKELKGYRRFRGYDYSRGATLFVTIVTAPRQNVFGRVVDDRVELNDCGRAAEETFQLEMKRNPALNVMECVIMPDHVHFMVHVRAGSNQPLRQIGQFVANFKRWTKYKVEKLGVTGFGWQENYHDWICLSREGMDAVAKYIKNNPLKWSLMHGANPPLKVSEPHELIRREIPFIKMVPDQLAMVYRPKDDEPILFGKGFYLLLSRVAPEGESRYDAWHGINAALAKMAEQNGVSLYVASRGGKLVWQFSPLS